ncbi:PREDICTED: gibberellin 2-beta-dioxygenase 8 [Nelumbo nucifera]|uniref:Fe2OG dioxygenase domain-containing protein n=2 Tax=Nelumbo nucifera TaxID=4432 RepID=A0A822Y0U9_NELNU|nr:PREDICTED: gibberellin 2-beta-dioxygenase 8 [Nelumbo nucifera]DAD26240.1 TPA_asm: hypothetical protein HUJ06_027708 [Nelumbo nucifera]
MSGTHLSPYPPLFRHSDDSLQPTLDSDLLPQIDFHLLDLDKLTEVCRDWGVFRLVNHGIPADLSNRLQDQAKKLFSLPVESKQALFNSPPMAYFWGTPALTPSGVAITQSAQNLYQLEGLFVLLNQLPQLQGDDPTLRSFRLLLEEYGQHMARLARSIFNVVMRNLGLDPSLSETYLSESTGVVRLYRYTHCRDANQISGMEAHTDSSVLSILNEDEVGGLEVYKDDRWIQVRPITNTLIVNLGDMMQAMSNDEYKSVKHRVLVKKGEDRMSICYFVFPMDDGVIQSTNYRPFTYKMFRTQVQEDIKATGSKVGLQRFMHTEPQIRSSAPTPNPGAQR